MRSKTCSKCSSAQPITHFSRNKMAKDGLYAWCRSCSSSYMKEWGKNNPDKKVTNQKRWDANNPGQRDRLRHLTKLRKYGLEEDEYERILEAQSGRCKICLRSFKNLGKRPAIDHDHNTGKVRGLLCSGCNTALGLMREDIESLQAAIAYLMSHM